MSDQIWEDMISLGSHKEPEFTVLEKPAAHVDLEKVQPWLEQALAMSENPLKNDIWPLPETKDREGYHGERHFNYWLSGLVDQQNLLDACKKYKINLKDYLDFGCASGRVIRHFSANNTNVQVYGCDINRQHIEWVTRFLSKDILAFQNHSIPTLPLPDNSLDLISAFSVFTHIEAFETTWLMEMNRVLRPGGLVWATIHTEHTWSEMRETWPLYGALRNHPEFPKYRDKPMEQERLVFRWKSKSSYSSNTFYNSEYIRDKWGRFFEVLEIRRRCPMFQDVVLLRKR